MKHKIIADSCCELSEKMQEEIGVELVPLTMYIDEKEYIDDDTLDIQAYLRDMKESKNAPKTSCPSIQDFLNCFRDTDNVFVVTISSKLSGTYNSAMQARDIVLEEFKDRFIHVFDSMSAVVGETLVLLKVHEYLKSNLQNTDIVDKVNYYIQEMKTFFLLENLDNLSKAGRMNPLIAKAANMLSIKPIMGEENGNIRLVDKVRGYERAFQRLVNIIEEEGSRLEEKVLGIAHCNCLHRAVKFKELVLKKYSFKDIVIVDMKGLSSTYANQGGLVIAF
ncbi:MAG: DegV family protein [Clostridiales bacterium]|nr:DegV family protein [Clostridiales bacterium]